MAVAKKKPGVKKGAAKLKPDKPLRAGRPGEYLTGDAYATHRGCTAAAVSQARTSGKIQRSDNGLYRVSECDAAWPIPSPLKKSAEDSVENQIALERLAGLQLKNKRMRGDLISRRVAEMILQGAAQVARQRIMAVPLAVSHQCASAKQTEIVEIITRALERAFTDTLARIPDFVAADTDFAGDSDG